MVEIVQALQAHHSDIADLLESVYIGEGFAPESSRERLRQIDRIAREATLLVAHHAQGMLKGVVVYATHGSTLAEIARTGEAEIRLLAVEPAARGQGIGVAILRACIARASKLGHARIVLSTQPGMMAAQRVYEHLGFVRVPARDWLHPNGSPRMVYARDPT